MHTLGHCWSVPGTQPAHTTSPHGHHTTLAAELPGTGEDKRSSLPLLWRQKVHLNPDLGSIPEFRSSHSFPPIWASCSQADMTQVKWWWAARGVQNPQCCQVCCTTPNTSVACPCIESVSITGSLHKKYCIWVYELLRIRVMTPHSKSWSKSSAAVPNSSACCTPESLGFVIILLHLLKPLALTWTMKMGC